VQVPTDSGTSSQTLNKSMVEDISLNGRDAAELIKIMPGTAINNVSPEPVWPGSSADTEQYRPDRQVLGSRQRREWRHDHDVRRRQPARPGNQGTQTANINQNQVQEVSILTNAYGAEFAKGPITFQAIGKSGGAQFHGQGYFYARNGVFNSTAGTITAKRLRRRRTVSTIPAATLAVRCSSRVRTSTRTATSCSFMPRMNTWTRSRRAVCHSIRAHPADAARELHSSVYRDLGTDIRLARIRRRLRPELNALSGRQIAPTQIDPNSAKILALMPAGNVNPVTNPTGANYQYLMVRL